MKKNQPYKIKIDVNFIIWRILLQQIKQGHKIEKYLELKF